MNIEEQDLILQIINQKEIIKSFLLKDAKNREEFKKDLSKIISNKDINLEKIIDELIDLYNSLLKIARFKNTRAQSLEDFDRIIKKVLTLNASSDVITSVNPISKYCLIKE